MANIIRILQKITSMFKITIIVPVYKVEQYVKKCILSILEQENCGASIECIVVDDCSPDNSMFIIHSIVKNYHGCIHFLFLKHDKNKGLSAARNTGIDAANGDYIMFVDSDDWLPTDTLSKFVKAILSNPNIDMFIGIRYKTKEKCIFPDGIIKETLYNNYQIRKVLLNYQIVTCSAWNKVIKSHIIKSNRFHEGLIFEDTYWAYFLFKDIKTALIIPFVTYIYENDHPCSIVNTANKKENISIHFKSVSLIGNAILDAPYEDLYADSIIYFFRYFLVPLRLQYEYNLDNEDCKEVKQLRKRLVLTTLRKGKLFLTLFIIILTYPPTFYMFNIGWVRRHYYIIEKIGRVIANFLERIHL